MTWDEISRRESIGPMFDTIAQARAAKMSPEFPEYRGRQIVAQVIAGLGGGLQGYRLVSRRASAYVNPGAGVTDRALRYRANQPDRLPAGPRRCFFCASGRNVEVHHLDGDESNDSPLNFAWACRSCNTRIGLAMRNLGLGRRTRQYNPGAESLQQYAWAVAQVCRRQDELAGRCTRSSDPEVLQAVELIRATPAARRREFSAQARAARGRYAGSADEVPF
jgi:hypothetical protein